MESSPLQPGLLPVLVGQHEVVVAAAAAAVAAAHCGAAPLAIGDAFAEAVSHLWRWAQPQPQPQHLPPAALSSNIASAAAHFCLDADDGGDDSQFDSHAAADMAAAKEAARNAARSASGMRSAGKSPSTGGPARHNLGVGEQRSQRSEDLVWEQVQEQERTVKDRAQQDLHPELGESPYHQKLTGAPGASYARATAADDDAAAAGGEGGDGGRGKRRGKPKSPKYFSHASQRAGNVPTPQEEYVARKRLDKIEKGIEQMMSDESRRHPPTWKIKHQKDVEKQELDRALAEALGVIEQKEKALGIGQRLNYGISAGGAAGGGGGRKVPRSLKGMSLTATANFKSAIGAV